MDKLFSVIAALNAGKLPTQNQVGAAIDWTLENIVPSDESPDAGKLSIPGKTLAQDTQYLLTAYKMLGDNKNCDAISTLLRFNLISLNSLGTDDNLLQDVLWHLSEGDFAEARVEATGPEEASTDLQSIRSEIRSFLRTLWTIEAGAAEAKTISREITNSAKDIAVCPRIRPKEIYHYICELAQKDKDYHRTLSTLLDIMSKWINKPLDTAADMNQSPSLEFFINDPSEKHVIEALRGICTLVERAADWPLVNIFAKAQSCTAHARNDRDINRWINELFVHIRKGLDEPNYVRSEEAQQMHKQLGERWGLFVHQHSDTGRMFLDVWDLMIKLHAFQHGITTDNNLHGVRLGHAAFGKYFAQNVGMGGQTGMHFALDHASWFWQDVLNVYAPRILRVIKDIPIPGTEYADNEIEFILGNINISSLSLLPGHGYITAPSGSQSTTTASGTLTHIRMQAVQLVLKEVSFFYKEKVTIFGPKEFVGLMEFILPTKGIDIDLKFRLIPNTPVGLKERERLGRFFKTERIEVTVAEDVAMRVQQCNQPIFRSSFKPVFMLRFREAFSRNLEEQIRGLFDTADALAFDIGRHSEVFQDAEFGTASSVVSALLSEIGKLCRMEGGLLAGRKAAGTGVVKDDLGGNATMGAEPQILPGEERERHTFRGTSDIFRNLFCKQTVVKRGNHAGKEGPKQVQSFKQSVEHKKLEEEKRRGWQSSAFDL
ncbi:hypothetical protein DEU56DRAFT_916462 [Suillus clintonianus]|uniref:uncharacterized protein n=1 Tax=Suillus clintonianus TaxID=1904413 RepID=UPI001B85C118|nr:uncharacterized protein DEU56DRAFT_916462 [Suillus clintonianus]KAG2125494.1 hypothetical protein DEU56DRAFT_916462 [Suillus clintonianus]